MCMFYQLSRALYIKYLVYTCSYTNDCAKYSVHTFLYAYITYYKINELIVITDPMKFFITEHFKCVLNFKM